MKMTILIVHGAGSRAYRTVRDKWVTSIQKSLGSQYEILCPEMPLPQYPQYDLWKATISETLLTIKGPLLLVGHSLGGTVLLKFMSEEKVKNNIAGLFTVASPYFGSDQGWSYEDFFLKPNPSKSIGKFPLFSYHCQDDKLVPIAHQKYLSEKFPAMIVKTVKGQGHEFSRKEFSEIITDIKELTKQMSA